MIQVYLYRKIQRNQIIIDFLLFIQQYKQCIQILYLNKSTDNNFYSKRIITITAFHYLIKVYSEKKT